MADVRSRRIFGPVLTTVSTSQLLYTVPALRTARFSLITATTSVNGVGVTLKVNGTAAADAFLKGKIPDALVSLDWPFDVCLNPGDALYATAGAVGGFYVTGFGSLLDGAPS